MILSRLPERTEQRTKEQFHLFKPLLLIALGVVFFELLPVDFKHVIAPRLVTYEEVYKSDNRTHDPSFGLDEMVSVNNVSLERLSLKPAAMTIRN